MRSRRLFLPVIPGLVLMGVLVGAQPQTRQAGPAIVGKAPKPVQAAPAPPKPSPAPPVVLLPKFLQGPMAGVEEIIFAVRGLGRDGHWYANFGYHVYGPPAMAYGPPGGKLCKLNLKTGQVTDLLNDPDGGVRDPQVHYDARKILFSYRKGGSQYYNLYEINVDGTGLRQITSGPFDDIEPAYLPDGGIVFGSSRCKRWVNCWLTQVAVLYRCGPNGEDLHPISSNNDHDNTPWVLPDGRILYMRWEYVDRNQVTFHHLWTMNPDGTGAMVFFGNMHPNTVMLDGKCISNSRKVVASFSPGHGMREHQGFVSVVDPDAGPDEQAFARNVSQKPEWRDPWAFSEDAFLVAGRRAICLMDGAGNVQPIYALGEELKSMDVHEPRPLVPRPRERIIPPKVDMTSDTGQYILADVTFGRNMAGVKPGEVKKLLILETLPMPVHFSGGMEPITLGGSFMLERILGTVPVEPDGSAYFEVPALRSVFFVAMDGNNNSVKRMQSFTSVMPGETMSCAGCHEQRTRSPSVSPNLIALRRPPSRIEPVAGIPEVMDFPRDIQPILDKYCLKCHDYDKRSGGVIFSGDRGPMYSHSYFTIMSRKLVADGRNEYSNRPPRTIGAAASRLMTKIACIYDNVKMSDHEREMIRYWIEVGAPYPGTYAAPGCGSIGGYVENQLQRIDANWPGTLATRDVIRRRCASCHDKSSPLPESPAHDVHHDPNVPVRAHHLRHLEYNLTRPEKSLILLGPLAPGAGGYGTCRARTPEGNRPATDIFTDTGDPDYQKILSAVRDAKKWLDQNKRFDMPDFRANDAYVREMKKYGILPEGFNRLSDPIDVYAIDRAYWKSLWYVPPKAAGDARDAGDRKQAGMDAGERRQAR
jgi:hypothetical protein